ncbi:MAG TPA: transcription antitermination factor NusB [Acidobacteriota bacterium]|nr:transcription antitermination factor NusB [Acidobacteriota bacterium]
MAPQISPARTLCYQLLFDIGSGRTRSDDALNSDKIQDLDVRDRHLSTEIVYGTLRWQGLLDYVLAAASTRPWPKVAEGIKILLRMSLYQMWKMDRIPEYALVNDAVEIARRELGKGIEGYINGILRRLTRDHLWEKDECMRRAPRWDQVSLPEWLYKRWAARYGEDVAEDFALSLNKAPQAAMRIFGDYATGEVFPFAAVKSDLVPDAFIRADDVKIPSREGIGPAAFHFQDEASQLIPHLLHPMPGWKIWDACAAPGGKTAILGKICCNSRYIVASDLRYERVARLAQILKDSGIRAPQILVADARQQPPFVDCFDAVLADAPCSGLGTVRRNPEIKWRFRKREFAELQANQTKILHSVSGAVRLGGWLLYSTCSTEPEENEQVIREFLNTHPGFCLQKPIHPPGIEKWVGQDSMVRTYPGNRLWDGFFAALMLRRS